MKKKKRLNQYNDPSRKRPIRNDGLGNANATLDGAAGTGASTTKCWGDSDGVWDHWGVWRSLAPWNEYGLILSGVTRLEFLEGTGVIVIGGKSSRLKRMERVIESLRGFPTDRWGDSDWGPITKEGERGGGVDRMASVRRSCPSLFRVEIHEGEGTQVWLCLTECTSGLSMCSSDSRASELTGLEGGVQSRSKSVFNVLLSSSAIPVVVRSDFEGRDSGQLSEGGMGEESVARMPPCAWGWQLCGCDGFGILDDVSDTRKVPEAMIFSSEPTDNSTTGAPFPLSMLSVALLRTQRHEYPCHQNATDY